MRLILSGNRQLRSDLGHSSTRWAFGLPAPASLHHVRRVACRTGPRNGLVPGDKITVGIAGTPEERSSLAGAALHNLAFAARGACNTHPCQQRTRIATFGKSTTSQELAILAELDDHRAAAILAVLPGWLILDFDALHCQFSQLQRLSEWTVELMECGHP